MLKHHHLDAMKSYKVSNFRLFDNKGAEISFKPITVLTGANSSGKSSFVKSLVAFADYLSSVLNEYRKDGGFNPGKQPLELLNKDLNFRGFTSIKNRNAGLDESVCFTLGINPMHDFSMDYEVTYSFNAENDDNNSANIFGELESIVIEREKEVVLSLRKSKGGKFSIEIMNLNGIISDDFINYCRYCLLPARIIRDAVDGDYGFLTDFCDDNGHFNPQKAAETTEGKNLAYLQAGDSPNFSYYKDALLLSEELRDQKEYEDLFSDDLMEPLMKCAEHKLIFYFPVLERFVGKSKSEAIDILREQCKGGTSLDVVRPNGGAFFSNAVGGYVVHGEEYYVASAIERIVKDFEKSTFDSFIDYYRDKENYVLEHVNTQIPHMGRWGKSFNYIEDEIIPRIDISYDSGGFTTRKETIFSLIYNVLSSWQWAEGEKQDEEWQKQSKGGKELSGDKFWAKDDAFISRTINPWSSSYSSSHKLYNAYKCFIRYILTRCLVPADLSKLEYDSRWVGTRRIHELDGNYTLAKSLKKFLEIKQSLTKESPKDYNVFDAITKKKYVLESFLNKWLQAFGICQHLEFQIFEGYVASIKLIDDNGFAENLADVGQGITQIVSILLEIEVAIADFYYSHIEDNPEKWVTPIIAIEEPEVSLHPCYQSKLAEMLEDAARNYGIRLIVETHSEYMIRKMQAIVSGYSEKEKNENPFVVYYFDLDGTVYDLGMKDNGRFDKAFGPGFFDESARLKYVLMTKEQNKE